MNLREAAQGAGAGHLETGVIALLGLGMAAIWALRASKHLNDWLRYGVTNKS